MVVAVGIDWKSASVDVRELFAIPKSAEASFMIEAAERCGARGCVLLKTCNRFELYLDLPEGESDANTANAGESAAQANPASEPTTGANPVNESTLAAVSATTVRDLVLSLHDPSEVVETPELFALAGSGACARLMNIACGLRSQVLGEDQIISQVRDAQTSAREAGCITPELETLFRIAVTCGKAVRTNVQFRQEGTSCARTAVDLAEHELGSLAGTRALVIGNGEMGRLAASLLVERGADTYITLRTYRHGATLVPAGCGAIPYDERMAFMEGCDVVVSATKSQHVTVTASALAALARRPRVLLDLAMPRDIARACGDLEGVRLLDLDAMRDGSEDDLNAEALSAARAIIDEQLSDFDAWRTKRAERLARRQPMRV